MMQLDEKDIPEAVIFPRNEDDISKIMKYCNEHLISVTPKGSWEWLYWWEFTAKRWRCAKL